MRNFALLSSEERDSLLRHNILRKCQEISSERLDFILSNINTRRRYFIQATKNQAKFINIMVEEYIATSSEKRITTIIPLYGAFSIGHFLKTDTDKIIDKGSMLENEPAAGVKISVARNKDFFSKTYTLAIFEPK